MGDKKEKKLFLPIIREDIRLIQNSVSEDGSKSWLIYDPIQNRYFTIGKDAFDILSYWENSCEFNEFLGKLREIDYDISEEDLQIFINFLISNNLIKSNNSQDTKNLHTSYLKKKQNFFKWLIKNYLFIRIPIVKPDKFLNSTLKYIQFFYSNLWRNIVLILGFLGIILILRDWSNFKNTFSYLFNTQGMFLYLISLFFVKLFHELGHAYTAKRYGCNVPTMGVAFLVLFPLLYTDTTDTWKIKSKYKRVQVVLAGVKTEIYLALIFSFLWSFLPEGVFKTIAFLIATTSWISSLLINISPFLRFDGYYALSDWTNSKNLQPRSFAMARWYLRKKVLGLEEEVPEYLPVAKKNFFIIYAFSTWIYRFFLFLGIAVLVYFLVFKVLGIILFIVEIIWFIFLPIFNELKIWYQKVQEVSFNKNNITSLFILAVIFFILFYPYSSSVKMPTIVQSESYQEIYPPYKSQIKDIFVKSRQKVKENEPLLQVESFKNNYELQVVNEKINIIQNQLDKLAASKKILSRHFELEKELLRLENEKAGLQKVKEKFLIKAPFDGIVYFNNKYHPSQWINPKESILTIYKPKDNKITAFCDENNLKNITKNMSGKLIFNIGQIDSIDIKIKDISYVSISNIEYSELTSKYGGDIAVREDKQGRLISEKAYYKVELEASNFPQELNVRLSAIATVEGKPSSIVEKVLTKVISILIRESGV